MPPAFRVTVLLDNTEWSTALRKTPSPQSAPSPWAKGVPFRGGHDAFAPGIRALSLSVTILPEIVMNEEPVIQIPALSAFSTVNPETTTWLVLVILIPFT